MTWHGKKQCLWVALDALFINERGELTEGGRTSIFVRPHKLR